MAKQITIRIQSPNHGTKRLEMAENGKVSDLLNKVQSLFELGDFGWSIYKERNRTALIRHSRTRCLDSHSIHHGDMLYLYEEAGRADSDKNDASSSTSTSRSSSAPSATSTKVSNGMDIGNTVSDSGSPPPATSPAKVKGAATASKVIEDVVDKILERQDGKILRNRNEQLCRHGHKAKCFHCVPLEPYDEDYLSKCDPPIKFLSFHAYQRKLMGGADGGKFANVENISCRIKQGCKKHPPWPSGICTECQPNAVTLNRQKYRHVDYISFENRGLMDRFLNYWRSTGCQRLGILYGKYEHHEAVPLGIKATVAAIYEPPQKASRSRIELLEDKHELAVVEMAEALGLSPVGWIFTDLIADATKQGAVKHFRGNINSHFLSAEECIMAAMLQNKHPNACKLSTEGHFGSKFVTVVVTGDQDQQIHFEGYQVSNQCMALVRDDCLIPTKDAAELGYVKESSNEQYVPDVFFKMRDEYNNEVTRLARPLPVEYLLLDMPAAFPVTPQQTFTASAPTYFPVENRERLGDIQDFSSLMKYMEQYTPDRFLQAMSDFHLLLFLATSEMLPLRERIGNLLQAVKNQNDSIAHQFKKTEEWATVEEMMAAHVPSPTTSRQTSYAGAGADLSAIGASSGISSDNMWTCAHCTFINPPGKPACDMCSLPR